MGISDTPFSPRNLLCQENPDACFKEQQQEEKEDDPCLFPESEDEYYIQCLLQRETTAFGSKSCCTGCSTTTSTLLKRVRLDCIEWIFNTRASLDFRFLTAYLSVTYFDRFFSKKPLGDWMIWAIRLLSLACLSLAAKMEQSTVTPLSAYKVQDYDFDNQQIQRAELLVLSTLEWKMGSITPFSYMSYFINKFCGEYKPEGLCSRVVELFMAVTKEINLMDHRPSIIAAAAVLVAIDAQLTKEAVELRISPIALWGSQENEHIFSCYNMMQDIEKRIVKTPTSVVPPHSAAGTRRRLNFNEQHCPVKRIHRL
ncbi:cyclin-D5-1-like isoform X2 [Castanea sativa]|uniref:cyclin-D5-1-like isoform X2 n=1 Tax=Castanea sativa TaxID=21020 RepID=UPI003AEB5533